MISRKEQLLEESGLELDFWSLDVGESLNFDDVDDIKNNFGEVEWDIMSGDLFHKLEDSAQVLANLIKMVIFLNSITYSLRTAHLIYIYGPVDNEIKQPMSRS